MFGWVGVYSILYTEKPSPSGLWCPGGPEGIFRFAARYELDWKINFHDPIKIGFLLEINRDHFYLSTSFCVPSLMLLFFFWM